MCEDVPIIIIYILTGFITFTMLSSVFGIDGTVSITATQRDNPNEMEKVR